jgi:ABC-2 type transport system permease protein
VERKKGEREDKMRSTINKIFASKFWWLMLLVILFVVNYLASSFHARFDLTKEKRYTLSKATKDLLRSLDGDVQVDVFLKGEFPSGFRKLANSTSEFLGLMKERNSSRFHYRFISPLDEMPGSKTVYGDSLIGLGAVPINLTVQKKAGESSNIIFPVALMHYKGKQSLVNLYPGASGRISQEEINSAEVLMEYQFVKSLDKLIQKRKQGIAYATGNGEPVDSRPYDLVQTLRQDYDFGMLNIRTQPKIPDAVDVLLVVKPTEPFTEDEKIKIDQYVMHGGKLICFIDNLIAEQDSLSFKPETIAFDRNLNLTDLFFKYGCRINTDLVMDLQCDLIPLVVGGTMTNPQFEFLHWNYFPLFAPGDNKLLNKNLGYVSGRFVNSIDTIQAAGIQKNVLLASSPNSRIIKTPALISLNENKNVPEDERFRLNGIPVAMLLQGKFISLYRNRISQTQQDSLTAHGINYLSEAAAENKIIVVADGDMVLNDITPDTGPLPMGWNKYTYREYQNQTQYGKAFIPVANREFLLNCVEYLVNNPAISETRNKDIVLRLLDSQKVKNQKTTWQFANIVLPVAVIMLFGFIYQQIRKRKYAA